MLTELHITDFAIIDRLDLSLGPGFNVLTGETGAGKSIIVDAINALLGSKLGAEFVRSGAEIARIEGIFTLPPDANLTALADLGIEPEEGCLILSRELHSSGRSICRINGRLVPVSLLQEVGQALVDIHGQSEHLSLLRPAQHVDLLDRYGGLLGLRSAVAAQVAALRAVRRELQGLMADEREIARRMDLLRYQIDEINAANLSPEEEAELLRERTILQNAERIMSLADTVYAALYAGSEGQAAAVDLVSQASAALAELQRLDPSLAEQASQAEGLVWQLQDLARIVRAYRDNVEYNPERLQQVEERLDLIHNLKRKYGSSIPEILAYRDKAMAELEAITYSEERLAELKEQEAALLARIGQLAWDLSQARQEAAARLAAAMERELAELNMPRVRFQVEIRQEEDPQGAPGPGDKHYAFDSTGIDKVEFLISPNPGEPLKPLAKIASGGETSRLMLAMRSILSAADAVPTLIFDEIDQGIGGRSGYIVGEKLWGLTARHQVICVTHLPQIAAFGDDHFCISKQIVADRTVTRARHLTGDSRVLELAEMLGGATEPALETAKAMLQETDQRKRLHRGGL